MSSSNRVAKFYNRPLEPTREDLAAMHDCVMASERRAVELEERIRGYDRRLHADAKWYERRIVWLAAGGIVMAFVVGAIIGQQLTVMALN